MSWWEQRAPVIVTGLAVALGLGCSSAQGPAGPSGAATVAVSGTVVSTQSGLPVPFAFLNGAAGTHFETDAAGRFTVTGAAGTTPVSTFVGMATGRVASGLSQPFVSRTINLGSRRLDPVSG